MLERVAPDRAKLDPEANRLLRLSEGRLHRSASSPAAMPDIARPSRSATARISQAKLRGIAQERSSQRKPRVHDPRVKALVIADSRPWPIVRHRDGLKDVRIPVQLWASELSGDGRNQAARSTPDYVAAIDRDLAGQAGLSYCRGMPGILPSWRPALRSSQGTPAAENLHGPAEPRPCVAFHKELQRRRAGFLPQSIWSKPIQP